jgi:HAD superfamily hydrolase (TIGR01490 family)
MHVALFDFDGTITNSDTLFAFIKFTKGRFNFFCGIIILTPIFCLYLLKLIPSWKAKELMLSYFFKGLSKDSFENHCLNFELVINTHIRKSAAEAIRMHKSKGHKVIIISASIENWIKPWAFNNDVDEVIATRIEFDKNNKFTGKFNGMNCNGLEKVVRYLKIYPHRESNIIYAYGDSIGDLDMLSFADFGYFKLFHI